MLPGVGGPAKRCWCAGHALLGALLRGEFTDPPVAWENENEGGGKETTGMGILCDVIHMGYIYIYIYQHGDIIRYRNYLVDTG